MITNVIQIAFWENQTPTWKDAWKIILVLQLLFQCAGKVKQRALWHYRLVLPSSENSFAELMSTDVGWMENKRYLVHRNVSYLGPKLLHHAPCTKSYPCSYWTSLWSSCFVWLCVHNYYFINKHFYKVVVLFILTPLFFWG